MGDIKGSYNVHNRFGAKYDDPKVMQEIIDDLLTYVHESTSIHLSTWCYKKGFSRQWLYETAKNYPNFAEALQVAKNILAGKVLDTSFLGGGNSTVGMAYLPVYDKEFVSWLEKKAEMNKVSQPQAQNQGAFNDWKKQQLDEKKETDQ
jgi:hypothetical protein